MSHARVLQRDAASDPYRTHPFNRTVDSPAHLGHHAGSLLDGSNNIVSDRACWSFSNVVVFIRGLALPRGSEWDGEVRRGVFIISSVDDYWFCEGEMRCDLLVDLGEVWWR